MVRAKSPTCGFCHKRGHSEKNCWAKTPALKPSTTSRQATTKGSPNDTSVESTQPSEHLNASTTSSHDPIHDGTSAAGEQGQQCLLLRLPNELLVEIAAFLCAPDEAGDLCFQAIKSFSLVSKRVRSVTMEQLPLTFSSQSLQFRQLIASKGYLSQVKQLVLKPKPNKTKFNRSSLRINGLLSHMPRLRELNIHGGVPLFGILRQGQLPTVRTLSVPINQYGPVYEVTSIIQACPNVVLLRLNVNGEPIWTGDGSEVSSPECRRALEAATALRSLQALEMFKFGSIYEILEVDISAGTYRFGDWHSHGRENGWVPEDLKVIKKYFPHICSLALYGNVEYDLEDSHVTISDLLSECGEIANLSSLTLTTEPVDIWSWVVGYSPPFLPSPVRYENDDEAIWSGADDGSREYPAVGRAFEACANLRELSFVYGPEGRTWTASCADREAHGQDTKAFETRDFVNSKYTFRAPGTDYIKHRWF